MAETYLEARNPNSIPYRPTWWEKYGLGARDDIASLREIPGNVIRVLKGDAFAAPLQIMTSPIRAGSRILQGRPLNGVGVRPTEVFDSPENVALTALAVAGPIARMVGGAVNGARGVLEFSKFAKSAKGIRDARKVARAVASGTSEVTPAAGYAAKALHWTGSPVRLLAEQIFKVPTATSQGAQVATDLAYTVTGAVLGRKAYNAYTGEAREANKSEAAATGVGANPGDGQVFVEQQAANRPPPSVLMDRRIARRVAEQAYADYATNGIDATEFDYRMAGVRANPGLWSEFREREMSRRLSESGSALTLEDLRNMAELGNDKAKATLAGLEKWFDDTPTADLRKKGR